MKNDFEVLIKGFKTKEEAQEFINWFTNYGEDYIMDWLDRCLEEGLNVRNQLNVDKKKTFKKLSCHGSCEEYNINEDGQYVMFIEDIENI